MKALPKVRVKFEAFTERWNVQCSLCSPRRFGDMFEPEWTTSKFWDVALNMALWHHARHMFDQCRECGSTERIPRPIIMNHARTLFSIGDDQYRITEQGPMRVTPDVTLPDTRLRSR